MEFRICGTIVAHSTYINIAENGYNVHLLLICPCVAHMPMESQDAALALSFGIQILRDY